MCAGAPRFRGMGAIAEDDSDSDIDSDDEYGEQVRREADAGRGGARKGGNDLGAVSRSEGGGIGREGGCTEGRAGCEGEVRR